MLGRIGRVVISGAVVAAGTLGGCAQVRDTVQPSMAPRPIEVVYRFENVRRLPTLDEWSEIRRVLEGHTVQAMSVRTSNERKYDKAEIRDYEAHLVVKDVSDLQAIQSDLDSLGEERIGGIKAKYSPVRAEVSYRSDHAGDPHDRTVRGVCAPAARVTLITEGGVAEVQANQYGAWAKPVKVGARDKWVYGYAEGGVAGGVAGASAREYFRVDVETMEKKVILEAEFAARN